MQPAISPKLCTFDAKIVLLLALVLALPTSQQIFDDDQDDADDYKMRSTTTPPPPLTDLITLDTSRLDWTCNDDKNRALIHFNFFNLTDAQANENSTTTPDDYDESFKIFYKYLSCHPANCKFVYLTSLNTTQYNATLRILVDNYYTYEFRFTYQRTPRHRDGHHVQKRAPVSHSTSDSKEDPRAKEVQVTPVNLETEILLCPFSTISAPIKFGVCDQYEFNIHQIDECTLVLSKPTPSGFVKYIYLFVIIIVAVVILINVIKKIKFKYQIIKS